MICVGKVLPVILAQSPSWGCVPLREPPLALCQIRARPSPIPYMESFRGRRPLLRVSSTLPDLRRRQRVARVIPSPNPFVRSGRGHFGPLWHSARFPDPRSLRKIFKKVVAQNSLKNDLCRKSFAWNFGPKSFMGGSAIPGAAVCTLPDSRAAFRAKAANLGASSTLPDSRRQVWGLQRVLQRVLQRAPQRALQGGDGPSESSSVVCFCLVSPASV